MSRPIPLAAFASRRDFLQAAGFTLVAAAAGCVRPPAQVLAPRMRPAGLERQQRRGRIIGDAHARGAGEAVDQRVRDRSNAAAVLPRKDQHAMRARQLRAAPDTRQRIDNANPKRTAVSFLDFILRPREQGLGFILIDRLDRIGAKAHAHARRARGGA